MSRDKFEVYATVVIVLSLAGGIISEVMGTTQRERDRTCLAAWALVATNEDELHLLRAVPWCAEHRPEIQP